VLSPLLILEPVCTALVPAVKELLLLEGAYLKGIDICCFRLFVEGSGKTASFEDAELLLIIKFCGQGSLS